MIRRYLFCLACLATLIAAFYAEEDWRGKRAWESYKHEAEARGEEFNRQAFIPPPVPDEQNFAMTPFLAPLYDFKPGTQAWRDTNGLHRANDFLQRSDVFGKGLKLANETPSNSWISGHTDLPAWQAAVVRAASRYTKSSDNVVSTNIAPREAASEVLAALAYTEPVLEEIRVASRRPYVRFNVRYENDDPAAILLPHLAYLKRFCVILQVRASAELALGKTDQAFNDIELMFYLTDAIRNESVVISQLVRYAQLQLTLQPIWEGLADHQWSEAQLQALQERLGRFDFCADHKRAVEAERVCFGGGIFDYLRRNPKYLTDQTVFNSGSHYLAALAVAPNGWLYLEQRNYDRMFGDYYYPILDGENHTVNPGLVAKANDVLTGSFINHSGFDLLVHHQLFCPLLFPALINVAKKTAQTQTGADFASLACALERYRLANGKFPENLDALVPKWINQLPHDVINGGPIHYRCTDDGRFTLYSVGWNETDDGGTVATGKKGAVDWDHGDWVWR